MRERRVSKGEERVVCRTVGEESKEKRRVKMERIADNLLDLNKLERYD